MNHLQPYPAYKDSGVPWLGDVPEHWKMQRGKVLFDCVDTRSSTGNEELLTVSSDRGVIPRKSATVTMFKAESYEGYKLCWPGDLVINSLWAWARGLGVSRFHGIISSAYGVYRLKPNIQGNIGYIHELVRSSPFQWELRVRSKGIWTSRLQLTDDSFLNAPFPSPPSSEQNAIVHYLDYMDKRIRRYINAKKKLIALLNEQKQAIIDRVVTRGLDLNVRLKPSGVEWMGDIPEYWETISLRYLSTKFGSGITPRGGATIYLQTGVPFLRSQNIHFDGLKLQNVAYIPRDLHEQLSGTHVHPNDILLNITGASIGRVCAVPHDFEEGNVNQHVCIIRPRTEQILPEYLAAYLSIPIMQQEINMQQNGASRQGLAIDAIKTFKILLPPLAEQKAIVQAIGQQVFHLVEAAKLAKCEIDAIHEYRTRLIADVVTGKLDVREAAANLPEEAEGEPSEFEEVESLGDNGTAVEDDEEALIEVTDDD